MCGNISHLLITTCRGAQQEISLEISTTYFHIHLHVPLLSSFFLFCFSFKLCVYLFLPSSLFSGFQSYHCLGLSKHKHSHARRFVKWMKASWQHVTTNPVAVPIVGAQYCWMRTIKNKQTWLHIEAERIESDIASQKSLAVIFLCECCDGVLFSTPQGTKNQCTPNNTFSQSEVESSSLNPDKTESESKARKNSLRSFSCLGTKKIETQISKWEFYWVFRETKARSRN